MQGCMKLNYWSKYTKHPANKRKKTESWKIATIFFLRRFTVIFFLNAHFVLLANKKIPKPV